MNLIRKELLMETNAILVDAADRYILPRFRNLSQSDFLMDGVFEEVVTTADRESSRWILSQLRNKFPDSYSEEDVSSRNPLAKAFWQIDPLDGTHEFTQGHRGFVIQAAFLVREDDSYLSKAGIIYSPLDQISVYGGDGVGVFIKTRNEDEIRLLKGIEKNSIQIHFRLLDPPVHLNILGSFLETQGYSVLSSPGGGAGSLFLQMIREINSGRHLFLFPRNYTAEWDLSAAEPLLKELGGWICDSQGQPFTYNRTNPKNSQGFIAALSLNKDEIFPLIRPWMEQELRIG